MKKILLIALYIAALSIQKVTAQSSAADSVTNLNSVAAARTLFIKNMGANAYLYNGVAYARYWNGIAGYPFFEKEVLLRGDLMYNGVFYEGLPLMYDLFRDELITMTFKNDAGIKLLGDKITAFSIGTHHFVKLIPDSTGIKVIKTGYYEKLYEGGLSVYVHHEKKIAKSLQVGENFSKFIQYDQYYIEKDGQFHTIDGESELQSVLKDHKTEIRNFINSRDIRYKKDPAAAIIQVAEFYDRLKK